MTMARCSVATGYREPEQRKRRYRVSKLAGRWGCHSVKPNNELAHGNQATVMNNIDAIGFVIVIVLLVWLFVLKR
jgi:hypothetical protein